MPVDAVVLGAGGSTGQQCVQRLLDLGKKVRCVARDPGRYKDAWGNSSNVEVAIGDVTDIVSVKQAIGSAPAVIFAASGKTYFSAGSVDKEGVRNVAEAAKEVGAHVVLVSSALVTPKNRFHPIRIILNNIQWGLMDAKWEGENLLRQSGAAYTIVRPGGLTNEPAGRAKLIASQGDSGKSGRVSRADVAAVCVAALSNPKTKGVTFELTSDASKQPEAGEVDHIFDNLKSGLHDAK